MWVLTYGDCMSLLLCFFIALFSMSEIKKDDRFFQVLESIQKAFGGYEGNVGTAPMTERSTNAIVAKLLELDMALHDKTLGQTDEEGVEGDKLRVTNVRDGLQVIVGGRISFDRFSATLKPEARELIARTAEKLRGYNTKILVRGHATQEPLPPESIYKDARDLSYARAKAVAEELEANGVRRVRMTLVAVGDAEPLLRQAYTEERRAVNRRVEILVTENLIDDFAGSTVRDELQEPENGGSPFSTSTGDRGPKP
jgi:chemotaxis protein MotB